MATHLIGRYATPDRAAVGTPAHNTSLEPWFLSAMSHVRFATGTIDWTGPSAVGAMKSAGISYSPLTLENQPDLT